MRVIEEMKTQLDLKTLKEVKFMFDLHSDNSSNCNGYKTLIELIKRTESEQNNKAL